MAHISQKSRFYPVRFFSFLLGQAQVTLHNFQVGNIPSSIDNPLAAIGEGHKVIVLEGEPFFVLIREETPYARLRNAGSDQLLVLSPYQFRRIRHHLKISFPDSFLAGAFKEFFSLLIPNGITHIVIYVLYFCCNRKIIKKILQ